MVPETYKISTEQFTLCRVGDDHFSAACSIKVVATRPSATVATLMIAVPEGTLTDTRDAVVVESEVDVAIELLSSLTDVGHAWVTDTRGPFLLVKGTAADDQVIGFAYTAPGPMRVPLGVPFPEVPSATTVSFIGRHGPMFGGNTEFIKADIPSVHFRRSNRPQLTLEEEEQQQQHPPPPQGGPPLRHCLVQ